MQSPAPRCRLPPRFGAPSSIVFLLAFALDARAAPPAASASSTLKRSKVASYEPGNAFDGDPATAWCEGAPEHGEGAWLEIPLGGGEQLTPLHRVGVTILPGYQKDPTVFEANGAASAVRVELRRKGAAIATAEAACDGRCELELEGPPAATGELALRVTMLSVRPGTRWTDTCITEVLPRFDPELASAHGALAAARAFCAALENEDARKLRELSNEKIDALRVEFTPEVGDGETLGCTHIELRSASVFDLRHPIMEGDGGFSTRRFLYDGERWRMAKRASWPLRNAREGAAAPAADDILVKVFDASEIEQIRDRHLGDALRALVHASSDEERTGWDRFLPLIDAKAGVNKMGQHFSHATLSGSVADHESVADWLGFDREAPWHVEPEGKSGSTVRIYRGSGYGVTSLAVLTRQKNGSWRVTALKKVDLGSP